MNDIEISRNTKLKNIREIYRNIHIHDDEVYVYGDYKAKIKLNIFDRLETRSNGKLVLVTSITPTKYGEGKSTVTIGLTQAFNLLNYSSIASIRQPSMGPVFGLKGGATGGGYSQVLPMEDINLNFTGDFHAITAAHNLIAATIDNHIYWGNELKIDKDNVYFKRVTDTNDRALRNILIKDKKYERSSSFQITAASELMAILCLSENLEELKERIGNIVVAKSLDNSLITVKDLGVDGACAVILKDAILPNLVQTTENTPVLIHGGPFANIAHGCSSVIATKLALKLCDYTITEAGFAADLGAEKFFDIKCRLSSITPDVAVLVVTCRAIEENGLENLKIHIENLRKFNIPIVIGINKFNDDTVEKIDKIKEFSKSENISCCVVDAYSKGSIGAVNLAKLIVNEINKTEDLSNKEVENNNIETFNYLYPIDIPIEEKIDTLVKSIYRATNIKYSDLALEKLKFFKDKGIDKLPICVSKTPMSITDDPKIKIPNNYTFNVTDIRPAFGAGFVVIMSGNIIDMPGLPKIPNAYNIDINKKGEIEGLS